MLAAARAEGWMKVASGPEQYRFTSDVAPHAPTTPSSPIDAIRALVEERREGPLTIMGIGGFGGAGKTTLARRVEREIHDAQVVATDAFWTGSSFDLGRLRTAVLDLLLAGEVAEFDEWDWASKSANTGRRLRPEGLIIVEGVCALHEMFRDDLRVRVWVDAPRDVRLERGVARDGEDSRATWENVWMPNELAYVERDAPVSCAHLVVDGTQPFG
jgi:uridine kinase